MTVRIINDDCLRALRTLPDQSVNCCVTSPPYWGLRDYGISGQIGLEKTPEEYITRLVEIFSEVRRGLTDDGTLWLNIGDCYAGSWGAQSRPNGTNNGSTLQGGSMLHARQIQAHPHETHTGSLKNTPGCKSKDLIGIPWMLASALRSDGWYLRSEIIWHKPNPMPESVTDRPTKSHEQIFLLAKSERYHYDAIKEPSLDAEGTTRHGSLTRFGRTERWISGNAHRGTKEAVSNGLANKRDVWTVTTAGYPDAHFATFPEELIEPCIKAGCPPGGTVLDPFAGSGTTGAVARRMGAHAILIEINPEYCEMARKRLAQEVMEFVPATA